MNKLQLKYNFLQILYWIGSCCICGYIAVFLQFKGMSNTEIGIVSGGGCMVTIFLSPFISSLISKIEGLTICKLMTSIYLILSLIFLGITFVDLSTIIIMILYTLLMFLVISIVPFLSMIATNYIQTGEEINFGLARGMGSISYAVSALLLGHFIDIFNPNILPIVFVISMILNLVVLHILPHNETQQIRRKKEGNVVDVIGKYKIFFFLLLGFSLMFGASTTLSTYLINIVKNLNGNTSVYGIAVFFMAASEMPVMSITPKLLKRYDAVTLILFASICYIFRNFTICLASNLPVLFLGMMFQSFSYGLLTAVMTYYVTFNLKENDQMMGHTLIGIMTTGLGSTIGNIGGGILQDAYGIDVMFLFTCCITVMGVIIIFIAGLIQKKSNN